MRLNFLLDIYKYHIVQTTIWKEGEIQYEFKNITIYLHKIEGDI